MPDPILCGTIIAQFWRILFHNVIIIPCRIGSGFELMTDTAPALSLKAQTASGPPPLTLIILHNQPHLAPISEAELAPTGSFHHYCAHFVPIDLGIIRQQWQHNSFVQKCIKYTAIKILTSVGNEAATCSSNRARTPPSSQHEHASCMDCECKWLTLQ